jgi:F-type H+-transporting ATPase subunit alpha
MGEYFMDDGKDVLVVFDNLTKHAWNYRQISLLLQRPPGREAYPGDIFYIHSQLVERGAKLSEANGAGSMTLLPIVETQEGDVTGLVCSNLISMTDGQLYLNTNLFNEGFRPAIDLGLSVSRIGSKVQYKAIKEVSKTLKWEHAQYRELVSLTKVRTKLSEEVESRLRRGKALDELLIQDRNSPLSMAEETVLFYAFNKGYSEVLDREPMRRFKKEAYNYMVENERQLIEELNSKRMLTPEIKEMLDKALEKYFKTKWQS